MKVKRVNAPKVVRSLSGKRQKSFRIEKTDKLTPVKDGVVPTSDEEWWNETDGKPQFVNKGLQAWEEGRKQWLNRDGCCSAQAASRERSLALLIALCFDHDDADTDCETEDEEGFFC